MCYSGPTSRLDVMSHAVDCVFQTSKRARFAAIPYTTRAFNGNSQSVACDITSNLKVGKRVRGG